LLPRARVGNLACLCDRPFLPAKKIAAQLKAFGV
jgi:hypothetical protein